MKLPISIIVYPFFGGWLSQCRNCFADARGWNISEAIKALSSAETPEWSPVKTECRHIYGSYSPRVNTSIDARYLPLIKEPVSITYKQYQTLIDGQWHRDPANTPTHIVINNHYCLDVVNAQGPEAQPMKLVELSAHCTRPKAKETSPDLSAETVVEPKREISDSFIEAIRAQGMNTLADRIVKDRQSRAVLSSAKNSSLTKTVKHHIINFATLREWAIMVLWFSLLGFLWYANGHFR